MRLGIPEASDDWHRRLSIYHIIYHSIYPIDRTRCNTCYIILFDRKIEISYRTSGCNLMNFESNSICNSYDSRHSLLKFIFRIIPALCQKVLFPVKRDLCSQNPNIWKTRHTIMSILRLLFYGATHTRPETRFSVSSGRIKIESSLLVKPYSNSKVIRLQGRINVNFKPLKKPLPFSNSYYLILKYCLIKILL